MVETSAVEALSIYTEAVESTLQSASVFALAALRGLAWKGVLSKQDADEVLKLPVDGIRFRELIDKHIKYSRRIKDIDFLVNTDAYKRKSGRTATLVVDYLEDENADQECVHYVGHDDSRKIILCVFRGSVTLTDWIEDAKLLLDRVPNPLNHAEGQSETVGLHLGFKTYIHGTQDNNGNVLSKVVTSVGEKLIGTMQDNKSERKIPASRMELVLQQLRELKNRFPSYSIHVQGHSLGGAMALIAALSIASDPLLTQPPSEESFWTVPVTCIAVGNPKPGDGDFCRAMEYLERTKKLRCCVIHNAYDIVPMLGTNVARLDNGYWHPGWRLLLYNDRAEWGRARGSVVKTQGDNVTATTQVTVETGCCGLVSKKDKESESMWNGPTSFNPLSAAKKMSQQRLNKHDHREYLRRLLDREEQLRKVHLDELYKEMWTQGNDDVSSSPDERVVRVHG